MSDTTRVTLDLRAETVTIEGPSAALTKLFEAIHAVVPNMEVRVVPGSPRRDASSDIAPRAPATSIGREAAMRVIESNARTQMRVSQMLSDLATVPCFASRYQPASTVDRIIVLAGYAATNGDGFTSQHMEEWFAACRWEAPPNMAVALNDAHSKAEVLSRRNRNLWLLNETGLGRLRQLERKVPP